MVIKYVFSLYDLFLEKLGNEKKMGVWIQLGFISLKLETSSHQILIQAENILFIFCLPVHILLTIGYNEFRVALVLWVGRPDETMQA